jgi:hypothetical protein
MQVRDVNVKLTCGCRAVNDFAGQNGYIADLVIHILIVLPDTTIILGGFGRLPLPYENATKSTLHSRQLAFMIELLWHSVSRED